MILRVFAVVLTILFTVQSIPISTVTTTETVKPGTASAENETTSQTAQYRSNHQITSGKGHYFTLNSSSVHQNNSRVQNQTETAMANNTSNGAAGTSTQEGLIASETPTRNASYHNRSISYEPNSATHQENKTSEPSAHHYEYKNKKANDNYEQDYEETYPSSYSEETYPSSYSEETYPSSYSEETYPSSNSEETYSDSDDSSREVSSSASSYEEYNDVYDLPYRKAPIPSVQSSQHSTVVNLEDDSKYYSDEEPPFQKPFPGYPSPRHYVQNSESGSDENSDTALRTDTVITTSQRLVPIINKTNIPVGNPRTLHNPNYAVKNDYRGSNEGGDETFNAGGSDTNVPIAKVRNDRKESEERAKVRPNANVNYPSLSAHSAPAASSTTGSSESGEDKYDSGNFETDVPFSNAQNVRGSAESGERSSYTGSFEINVPNKIFQGPGKDAKETDIVGSNTDRTIFPNQHNADIRGSAKSGESSSYAGSFEINVPNRNVQDQEIDPKEADIAGSNTDRTIFPNQHNADVRESSNSDERSSDAGSFEINVPNKIVQDPEKDSIETDQVGSNTDRTIFPNQRNADIRGSVESSERSSDASSFEINVPNRSAQDPDKDSKDTDIVGSNTDRSTFPNQHNTDVRGSAESGERSSYAGSFEINVPNRIVQDPETDSKETDIVGSNTDSTIFPNQRNADVRGSAESGESSSDAGSFKINVPNRIAKDQGRASGETDEEISDSNSSKLSLIIPSHKEKNIFSGSVESGDEESKSGSFDVNVSSSKVRNYINESGETDNVKSNNKENLQILPSPSPPSEKNLTGSAGSQDDFGETDPVSSKTDDNQSNQPSTSRPVKSESRGSKKRKEEISNSVSLETNATASNITVTENRSEEAGNVAINTNESHSNISNSNLSVENAPKGSQENRRADHFTRNTVSSNYHTDKESTDIINSIASRQENHSILPSQSPPDLSDFTESESGGKTSKDGSLETDVQNPDKESKEINNVSFHRISNPVEKDSRGSEEKEGQTPLAESNKTKVQGPEIESKEIDNLQTNSNETHSNISRQSLSVEIDFRGPAGNEDGDGLEYVIFSKSQGPEKESEGLDNVRQNRSDIHPQLPSPIQVANVEDLRERPHDRFTSEKSEISTSSFNSSNVDGEQQNGTSGETEPAADIPVGGSTEKVASSDQFQTIREREDGNVDIHFETESGANENVQMPNKSIPVNHVYKSDQPAGYIESRTMEGDKKSYHRVKYRKEGQTLIHYVVPVNHNSTSDVKHSTKATPQKETNVPVYGTIKTDVRHVDYEPVYTQHSSSSTNAAGMNFHKNGQLFPNSQSLDDMLQHAAGQYWADRFNNIYQVFTGMNIFVNLESSKSAPMRNGWNNNVESTITNAGIRKSNMSSNEPFSLNTVINLLGDDTLGERFNYNNPTMLETLLRRRIPHDGESMNYMRDLDPGYTKPSHDLGPGPSPHKDTITTGQWNADNDKQPTVTEGKSKNKESMSENLYDNTHQAENVVLEKHKSEMDKIPYLYDSHISELNGPHLNDNKNHPEKIPLDKHFNELEKYPYSYDGHRIDLNKLSHLYDNHPSENTIVQATGLPEATHMDHMAYY